MASSKTNALIFHLIATAANCPSEVKDLVNQLTAAVHAERIEATSEVEHLKAGLAAYGTPKDADPAPVKHEVEDCRIMKVETKRPSLPPTPPTTAAATLNSYQPIASPQPPPFRLNGPTFLSGLDGPATEPVPPAFHFREPRSSLEPRLRTERQHTRRPDRYDHPANRMHTGEGPPKRHKTSNFDRSARHTCRRCYSLDRDCDGEATCHNCSAGDCVYSWCRRGSRSECASASCSMIHWDQPESRERARIIKDLAPERRRG
ncbi:hypothetical protein LTR36_006294 [Oleoguttula mirabilis]|uniref:Uncharacterized protein n=1 Tax=Oleoguttula mirabilis TaxID=1507867 RepID=A0AAV9JE90_9PEZI|nr:hypothetical protein LTR36_006294 [Oleoguttula mirabilis]